MTIKEEIIEEFCEIASAVTTNLRKVKTFDEENMTNKYIDEYLICDCFCDRKEWKKYNKVNKIVMDFIKKAVEDKLLDLDIEHELKELNLNK